MITKLSDTKLNFENALKALSDPNTLDAIKSQAIYYLIILFIGAGIVFTFSIAMAILMVYSILKMGTMCRKKIFPRKSDEKRML